MDGESDTIDVREGKDDHGVTTRGGRRKEDACGVGRVTKDVSVARFR
jgi:hypothetical protein